MSQNDSSDILKKWRSGVEFSFAWYKFADPYALRTYRECSSVGGQQTRKILMVADLWAGLGDGEFQAFGKCVAPEISNGPVLIPTHTFEFEPPHGIEESNDFEISGWRYEGVKVIRIHQAGLDNEAVHTSEPESNSAPLRPPENSATPYQPVVDVVPDETSQVNGVNRPKRGGGNRNLYTDVRAVLVKLFAESKAYRMAVAQPLLKPFNKRYVDTYSTSDIKRSPISERTLRVHLKTYRQELAEIGEK